MESDNIGNGGWRCRLDLLRCRLESLIRQVWLIKSCPHVLNKVVDALQQKFTSISKTQLRNKVCETSSLLIITGR
ncbi:chromatin assembly factor 1 subunit FAS1-like protein [Carex littledalei]|uniref:Chromatin assembly factor 1 subunit FAS1-like protein n=1 Tax=Carex littledalei TaxID=544730 RepID=A0A833RUK4_9POAL|nr:chromatin assembly factor 1 subunit FAS1-like protein [Carex littledalei]